MNREQTFATWVGILAALLLGTLVMGCGDVPNDDVTVTEGAAFPCTVPGHTWRPFTYPTTCTFNNPCPPTTFAHATTVEWYHNGIYQPSMTHNDDTAQWTMTSGLATWTRFDTHSPSLVPYCSGGFQERIWDAPSGAPVAGGVTGCQSYMVNAANSHCMWANGQYDTLNEGEIQVFTGTGGINHYVESAWINGSAPGQHDWSERWVGSLYR